MNTTNWQKEFDFERDRVKDKSKVVAVAPDESALETEFDNGYGGSEGPLILIWTKKRVYFPVVYDGAEWMGSAPRDPTSKGQEHVGGQ